MGSVQLHTSAAILVQAHSIPWQIKRANPRRPQLSKRNTRERLIAASAEASSSTNSCNETVFLGNSEVQVSSIGVGTWSWGDRSGYWGWEKDYDKTDCEEAFKSCLASDLTFIDTAEVYGFGLSEELLGAFLEKATSQAADDQLPAPVIATKFAPIPWRFTKGSVVAALRSSLDRLQVPKVDLYMQHWPGFPVVNSWAEERFLEGLAECYNLGLTRAIGVSNFNEERLRRAHAFLSERGIPLASNQVQYSLLYRKPEENGLLEACQELGVTLVAYSPLAQGLLTGKYSMDKKPQGPRASVFTDERLGQVEPLIALMREIGHAHGGKSPSQVALNWCLCKNVVPIPGVKTPKQAQQVRGAMGWRLTPSEVKALDDASEGIRTLGAPFEEW